MTRTKRRIAVAFAAAATAFSAPAFAQPDVMASELYFQDQGPNRLGQWTADALIARYPVVLRALRTEGVAAARLAADECSEAMACYRNIHDEFAMSGERLVSVLSSTSEFSGGAHGMFSVEDRLFDVRSGTRLRFTDLFSDWSATKPLLQAKVCAELRQRREQLDECPDVGEIAWALSEAGEIPVGGKATGFEFRTSDYQLGSYAAGRDEGFVALDAQLLGLIKADYRADFRVASD